MTTKKQQPNLHPENLHVPSSAEARENGRKGGIASGKARRLKGVFKKLEKIVGDLNAPDKVNQILKQKFEFDKDLSNRAAAVFAQYAKALGGDTAAYKALRDSSDETEQEQERITYQIVVSDPKLKAAMEHAEKYGLNPLNDGADD